MINSKEIENRQNIYEALLNELLKPSSQAIVLLNTDAEIIFCSQSIRSITGYEAEELIGKTAFDFFHPDDLPAARQQHDYLTELKLNASVSLIQIRNKHGHMIWIDALVKNLLHVGEIQALFVLMKKSTDAAAEERKLMQALTNAREQEREFLATELHDNINQIISATKLLVDQARLSSDKEQLLKFSSENLQKAAEEIRRLSYSMVSYDLHEFGLAYAVNAFITTIGITGAITFRMALQEEAVNELTVDQQLQVYRIIQEGTNIIIRHADATMAEITLTREKDLIYLIIADNGKGFSVNRLKPGMGLSSITNRVKLLKGHFHIRAPQDTGTTIEIHFPV